VDWTKLNDFVAIEQELLEEFKAKIEEHIPDGMVILKKGWEDLFLFFKAAQAASMPDIAFHKQMQKLIGGWYSQGAVKG
jgi:hypothetical protein